MSRNKESITRGYNYMLPLPSDMDEDMIDPVQKLGKLWVDIFRQRLHLHNKDQVAKEVNDLFDSFTEEEISWLERDDPKHLRPRGVLVKERAIQYVQMAETPAKKRRKSLPELESLFLPIIKLTRSENGGDNDKITHDD